MCSSDLLKALFEQTITQQLPSLKLAWRRINGVDTRGDPERIRLLEQAKLLASTPPLSEREARDPALLALFDGMYDREQGNPQAERVMHQWRQTTEARLNEALRLVEQGLAHYLQSIQKYVVCPQQGCEQFSQLLICVQCGQVQEAPMAPALLTLLKAQMAEQHFTLAPQFLELKGVCLHCQSTAELPQV